MSEVLLVKRLLVQASVSVLAGMLMSSAVLAEDDAASGDTDVGIEVIDPMPIDEPIAIEDGGVELVDPICADCGTGEPDVSIDPVELDGEDATRPDVTIDPIELDGEVVDVPVEAMQNEVTLSGGPEVQRDAVKAEPRGDHGNNGLARSPNGGETPAWLKNLFKVK